MTLKILGSFCCSARELVCVCVGGGGGGGTSGVVVWCFSDGIVVWCVIVYFISEWCS